jgi:hypothetical protein
MPTLRLPNAEKKKLKISFPSKNFKNAYSQSDTKTFGQLVAKLNIDNGCVPRRTRTPACNTGLAKVAIQCSADTFVVNQSLVLRINPPRRMVKIATFAKPQNVTHKQSSLRA